MMRLALLAGVVVLSTCASTKIHAEPTEQFPVTWDGETTAEALPDDAPAALLVTPTAGVNLVAVLPIDLREAKFDNATRLAFEEHVRTVAGDELSARGFTLLTGETTLSVLADNGVDPSKVCEASCALAAARELKARIFLSGSVAKSEGAYVAFVRVFEVDTGRQLGSTQLEGKTVRELREAFTKRAPGLFAKVLGPAR